MTQNRRTAAFYVPFCRSPIIPYICIVTGNKQQTMRTISNSEFVANPDMYFGMAREQDVRIRKGRQMFRLVHEPPAEQPFLEPDDELRRAITIDEFLDRFDERLKQKWAERRK